MFPLCLVLSIFLGVFCYLNLIVYKDLLKLPGPSLVSYFKNLLKPTSNAEEAFEQLISLNRVFGPVVKIWVNPFTPKLVVTNLKCIEQLLSTHAHLDRTKFYEYFGSFAGLGLTALPVSTWKFHRKILNPAFHTKILQKYVNTFEQFGQELVTELKENANGVPFDIHIPININTLHIIVVRYPAFLSITQLIVIFSLATIMQATFRYELGDCLKYLKAREIFYRILEDRSLSLLTQYDFLFRLTRTYWKCESSVKTLNDLSERIIEDYKKRQMKSSRAGENKHAIDLIFENYDLGSREMLHHISTFIVAGHETISVTLSFALYELAKRPEVQRKIVEEAKSVLGENKDAIAEFSDFRNLKYVECVIKECLRMYTNVPAFERKTTEDMEIDGVRIPKGTGIMICAYNVHMDENNYPNPHLFDPDRFLPENEHKIKPFTFLAFSLGPRNCIGKQLAMLELKSLLTKILRHYEVLPAETPAKMRFLSEFTLKSSIGTPVRLIPRV